MFRQIKQHLKKHRTSWRSYRRWRIKQNTNEYWFCVNTSQPFFRFSENNDPTTWDTNVYPKFDRFDILYAQPIAPEFEINIKES